MNLPVDCTLNQTCYIQQYPDRDPGPGAADYTCGTLVYDGHKGTDFALPSFAAMHAGVDVLAAAPGVVTALRDGMPDTGKAGGVPDGKDCGNGLVVRHGDGWETQYCHLANGSVQVTKGQRVAKGTVLGQIGFSGTTEFPHLHLSVRQHGQVIDPFAPNPGPVTCTHTPDTHLWQLPIAYQPGGIIALGLADHAPEYAAIKAGQVPAADTTAPALVAWGYGYGAQAGDQMRLTITGPNGVLIEHDAEIPRNRAQFIRAAGKKRPPNGWPTGHYTVTVQIWRNGRMIDADTVTLELAN